MKRTTVCKLGVFFFVASLITVGCRAKITGTLQVDHTNFKAVQCRSGQALGFSGIELTDTNGRRLRLFASPDGTCTAAVFRGDSTTGDRIGPCGVLTMEAQSSRINSIVNLRGTAKLGCEAGTHNVTGDVEFENCH